MRKLTILFLATALAAFFAVSATASPRTKNVKVADSVFSPRRITIRKGTKVTWKWDGFLEHNVTVAKGPAKFHSRILVSGSFSHVFTKKGTYFLRCTLHPASMKETITVK
jgi:plastocyanin